MKVFMIGGTGLLGCEAAIELIKAGHQVKSVALPPLPVGAPIPKEMELEFKDINKCTDEEVEAMLAGCDVFMYAAGVDERKECPPPVYEVYKKFNNDPLERLLPICKKVGVKNAVICGSYFSYMYKLAAGIMKNPANPDQKIRYTGEEFLDHNPYIRSRIEQEKIVEKYLKIAGLDGLGLSVHKLRHTAATLMYQEGHVDVRLLQEILGHSNLSTTQIYTHVSSDQLKTAIDANPLSKLK